jgi:hypothetical protein
VKPEQITPHNELDKELKRTPNETIVQASVNVSCNEQIDEIMNVIDATEYSNFTKLIRVTAYVIRFLTNPLWEKLLEMNYKTPRRSG